MLVSVVITVVDGGATLVRCLDALLAQTGDVPLEIIVPYDDSVTGMEDIARRFPAVRFIPLGPLATSRPVHTPAGQHELYDGRRSAGLAAARGELVAMLEDRGAPRPDWAESIVALRNSSVAAFGGAIENANRGVLNWAVYFCDFGRYQLPFQPHAAPYVSDTNICYTRAAIESTRDLWRERYHETTVHWALQRAGGVLMLSPRMVVEQDRGDLRLSALVIERLQFGRLFAYTRARELTAARRLTLAAATPVLPLILFSRIAARQRSRPSFRSFLRAAPALLLLLIAWSAGEAAGYVTGRA